MLGGSGGVTEKWLVLFSISVYGVLTGFVSWNDSCIVVPTSFLVFSGFFFLGLHLPRDSGHKNM